MNDVKKLNVFGVEYDLPEGGGGMTEQEKEQFKQDVLDAVFDMLQNHVDDDGRLVLEGLNAGTYKLYYDMEDGSLMYIRDEVKE